MWGTGSDVLGILESIFLPLQGFNNFLIYSRPIVYRIRMENPDKSYFWAFRTMIRDAKDVPNGYVTRRWLHQMLGIAPMSTLFSRLSFNKRPDTFRHPFFGRASSVTSSNIGNNAAKAIKVLELECGVRDVYEESV
eukprot:CAMPEP_0172489646 /NCGR_PEP_ID=MMETSP1066-20121228/19794_1 /TAXON_ID=671091 /ORGANISM="Coscinodiscus wailesii, Strain CCMP2513" /LENGTH=135 /DNA_ID=CAMNT_0013257665 /DNA_START=415 /DNA_END=822 /DNA_ORIENTATION=-